LNYPGIPELLRHEHPMSLLQEVLSFGGGEVACAARVTEDCPFLRKGVLPGVALLEYMAQAIAAFVTLERRRTSNSDSGPRTGYLVAARDVEVYVPSLVVGDRFEVRAVLDWTEAQVARFSCQVMADRCLASGRLTVYEPKGAVP
jgi:predicted hotdog family 3-hydroxylacyl-ACP dehydratase